MIETTAMTVSPWSTTLELSLVVNEVSKVYLRNEQRLEVLRPTSFTMLPGELFVIFGPSGCGKTTLLRVIAGLEKPSSGTVFLDGSRIQGPSRQCGMVFQDYTLFPWLTVSQNIGYGLRLHSDTSSEAPGAVAHWIREIGLEGFEDFYPKDLSGGMQQRVAIARTLANRPKLLLMDEPFGSLDAQTRWQMQDVLVRLQRAFSTSIVFVTHDVEEAVFLGDRIAVFSPRPATLLREFVVPFGKNRTRSITRSHAYLDLEQEVLSIIRSGSQ